MLSSVHIQWMSSHGRRRNQFVMIISYIASLFGLLFMKRMLACVSARMIYLIVLMVVSLSFFIYIPWPGKFPQLIHQVSSNGSSEMVGCDYFKQSWCLTIPKLHEIQFFLAPVIFFFSFPILYAITIILASKIIGPHPPGVAMGIIGTSASLGRGVGPLILVPLYYKYGPQIAYACMDGVVMVAILLTLLIYNRLVPYGYPRRCF